MWTHARKPTPASSFWLIHILLVIFSAILLMMAIRRIQSAIKRVEPFEVLVKHVVPVDDPLASILRNHPIKMDESDVKGIHVPSGVTLKMAPTSSPFWITDMMSASMQQDNIRLVSGAYPYRRSLLVFSRTADQSRVLPLASLLDDKQKTIGFVLPGERRVFEHVCYTYLGSMSRVKEAFEFIRLPSWSAAFAESTQLDACACFLSTGYTSEITALLKRHAAKLQIYDYEPMQFERQQALSFFMPFSTYQPYDFPKAFPEVATFFRVLNLIQFDLVVCATSSTYDVKAHGVLVDHFSRTPLGAGVTMHLATFLPTYAESLAHVKRIARVAYNSAPAAELSAVAGLGDAVANSETSLPVMIFPAKETGDSSVHVITTAPVRVLSMSGHPEIAEFRTLVLASDVTHVEGIRIRIGDTVELRQQQRSRENGTYVVIQSSTNTKGPKLSSMYYINVPQFKFINTTTIQATRVSSTIPESKQEWFRKGTKVYVANIDKAADIIQVNADDTVLLRVLSSGILAEMGNEEGSCITNSSIMSRWACESKVDPITKEPKKTLDVWDKPCRSDSECPFFQGNRTYYNVRGGCHNGYCEMPVGVKRLSYRKYALNDESFPYCHGCKDPLDPNCCDLQQTPNYAFPMDHFERLAEK